VSDDCPKCNAPLLPHGICWNCNPPPWGPNGERPVAPPLVPEEKPKEVNRTKEIIIRVLNNSKSMLRKSVIWLDKKDPVIRGICYEVEMEIDEIDRLLKILNNPQGWVN